MAGNPHLPLGIKRVLKMEEVTFQEISRRLHETKFPAIDCVIGILNGGRVPATLLAHQLKVPLVFLSINYRDEDNNPRYEDPKLFSAPESLPVDGAILLVDDVSVSGKTMQVAREQLSHCRVTTFVLKGRADHVLFPEFKDCVNWPWKSI